MGTNPFFNRRSELSTGRVSGKRRVLHSRSTGWGRRLWNGVVGLLVVGVALLAAGWFLLHRWENRRLYHPAAEIAQTPYALHLSSQAVHFKADDGISLSGWWVPAPYPVGSLVVFHGFSGNRSNLLPLLDFFHRRRLNVFLWDYRGYGDSEGRPSERGLYRDGLAALDVAVNMNRFAGKKLPLLLYGHSFGAAVALKVAAARSDRVDGLILEAAPTSVPDLFAMAHPREASLARHLFSQPYAAVDAAARTGGIPKLFLHSTEDSVVPFRNGIRLCSAAADPKQLVRTSGEHSDHAWLQDDSPALPSVLAFLDAFRE